MYAPFPFKTQCIQYMALGKISHHFENTRIEEKQLEELDSKITKAVKEMFDLYPKSSASEINFLGYALDANGRLAKTKTYGGNSDWPDLLFHANKFNGSIIYKDGFCCGCR